MSKALVISIVCAACAFCQTATTIQRATTVRMGDVAAFGPVGITTALAGPMSDITGAPYSAQSTTERVQMLADGNRIVQATSGSVARDAQGRVRREESLPGLKTNDGEAPRIVMIDDPVSEVHWTLDERTKTALKMPLPNIKSGAYGVVAGSGISSGKNVFFTSLGSGIGSTVLSSRAILKNGASPNGSNVTKTDLGTQTVEGVPAQGTRITRTIPAGQFGNEQPMIITTETWYSPDLKVLVMSKSSDPRMGDTTYTLTNIQRAEPSESLFQVPDDYTVRDAQGPVLQLQKPQ
ncbi:MAG: hypothetical protein M3Y57_21995 [Acidobacteriota bacterium]|nr:hypothetical protein [Acidobacteriota bacterium]